MPRRPSLYKDEREIALLVLGGDVKGWDALAAVWEREGLPKIDLLTGKKFWPAVEKFFFRRHGLVSDNIPSKVDGAEQW